MIKPKWKDAPEWAEYLAQDSDGVWHWYRVEPSIWEAGGMWESLGDDFAVAMDKPKQENHKWTETLESRS